MSAAAALYFSCLGGYPVPCHSGTRMASVSNRQLGIYCFNPRPAHTHATYSDTKKKKKSYLSWEGINHDTSLPTTRPVFHVVQCRTVVVSERHLPVFKPGPALGRAWRMLNCTSPGRAQSGCRNILFPALCERGGIPGGWSYSSSEFWSTLTPPCSSFSSFPFRYA